MKRNSRRCVACDALHAQAAADSVCGAGCCRSSVEAALHPAACRRPDLDAAGLCRVHVRHFCSHAVARHLAAADGMSCWRMQHVNDACDAWRLQVQAMANAQPRPHAPAQHEPRRKYVVQPSARQGCAAAVAAAAAAAAPGLCSSGGSSHHARQRLKGCPFILNANANAACLRGAWHHAC